MKDHQEKKKKEKIKSPTLNISEINKGKNSSTQ